MFLKRKEPVKDNILEKVGDIFTVNLLVETDNGNTVKDVRTYITAPLDTDYIAKAWVNGEKIAITLFDASIVSVDMMLVTDYSIIPCKTEYVIEDFLKEPKSSSLKVLGGYYSYEEKRILRY